MTARRPHNAFTVELAKMDICSNANTFALEALILKTRDPKSCGS
jgi:hypothetical protein